MKPMFSQGHATCCTILSVFGVIFLGTMSYLFSIPAISLTHTVDDPEDPADIARACMTATFFYAFMILFCGCQSWLNKREERSEIQLQ
ncbi:hypothetical protein BG000_011582 [Podila horticola]|nr:hypothetical protein BG000_011582 [Podila horticola]